VKKRSIDNKLTAWVLILNMSACHFQFGFLLGVCIK